LYRGRLVSIIWLMPYNLEGKEPPVGRRGAVRVSGAEPHYHGHRLRLRRRFRRGGGEGFHDYELLELLLTYALPRADVKTQAKDLIKRFGGLQGVLDAGFDEMESVPGVGPASATLIRLVKEIASSCLAEGMRHRDLLSSPQAVVDFARLSLAGLPHEAFMVIYLNTKNEVIDHERVHEGTIDRAVVYPRRIVEAALAHHAAGLVLVHNHPSGHIQPSEEDREITRAIVQAAGTVDIRVLDHIVVGRNGYLSFVQEGLLSGGT
jgi:DNA repair protein RadC